MINLFINKNVDLQNCLSIKYLIDKYSIKKIVIDNELEIYEYILKNQILYNYNIIVEELNKDLLERLTIINYCNNVILLNIAKLDKILDYSYVKNYNIKIIDYNYENIEIINNIIPILNEDNKIYKIIPQEKKREIGIVGNDTDEKNKLLQKLLFNDIQAILIDENKDNLLEYKMIIDLDNKINNEELIMNKTIIIKNKKGNDKIKTKYTIDINDDSIGILSLFTIKNYQQIINTIYKNYDENEQEQIKEYIEKRVDNMMKEMELRDKIGFIMIRHVCDERTNNYWIENYRSVRKYYSNKIIIIDDNSNYNYIKMDEEEEKKIYNCEIIQSEHKGRGEILGYYYYYKYRFFEKAVIIHDSVFMNKKIDFDQFGDIRFIWHFTANWFDKTTENKLLSNIEQGQELEKYYEKENRVLINGCFGVQSVITYKFLYELEEKYKFLNLLDIIDNRNERMNFERIFALMCINERDILISKPSIYGVIHEYLRFGYPYEEYLEDKKENRLLDKDIIKVWTGR